ncbi:hypothetical protein OUZ56_030434 [Daphnia magna]|uniref:Uncharacterized protein n=1 Tax=Daphnia magna TaxID=35525 RepID=A0ABQ9ZRA3_9CRUS|nr:hypothetical protein OUZ56_030434 [Daphnia magna]
MKAKCHKQQVSKAGCDNNVDDRVCQLHLKPLWIAGDGYFRATDVKETGRCRYESGHSINLAPYTEAVADFCSPFIVGPVVNKETASVNNFIKGVLFSAGS